MTDDEKKAIIERSRQESNERLAEAKRNSPAYVREALQTKLIPRYAHMRGEWLSRLEELAPRVEAMTPDEAYLCLFPRTYPDWYQAWEKFKLELRDALLPYLRKDQLEDGAFYRISCRNAHCGVWREDQTGFEIPREKFGSNYLFVEYHWDNGPPFGTSKPWEKLEPIPEEVGGDEGRLLRYMQWRNAEITLEDRMRWELKLSQWDPVPEKDTPEWLLALHAVRSEEAAQRKRWGESHRVSSKEEGK